MKTLSYNQIKAIKTFALESIDCMNFNRSWFEVLKRDLEMDCDRSCNAIELARYISWHMEHHKFEYGMSYLSEDHFISCSFQAVLYGTNETLAGKII